MTEESTGEIQVVCRFRPLNAKEREVSNSICIEFGSDKKSVIVPQDGMSPLRFTLDHVFTPTSLQSDIYKTSAQSIVESVLQGFNGTVLAYGQTSSGKTFTMTGAGLENPELIGIIPRMVNNVFDYIASAEESLEFTVKISYCEIYMEKIKDLLDPFRRNLKVHEDKLKGVYIGELSETYVNCDNEVYELMKTGTDNREIGYTEMNAGSSRSHAIFIVAISQTNVKTYSTKVGRLYLVDLAGSEKVGKTGASGKRLEEAKTINKSLTVLGQVINNLTDGKSTHIPYRDSKLTRVLQDALGGNSKTSLIVTCSPSIYNIDETIGTLRFGVRAKSVKNKPKVNKEYTVAELKVLLAKAQEELENRNLTIDYLQKQLKGNGDNVSYDNIKSDEILVSLDELYADIEDLREKLEQEIKTSGSLRSSLLQQEAINQEISLDNSTILSELKDCHEEILTLKSMLAEKSELVQELANSKELYAKETKDLNFASLKLQSHINELEDELSKLKASHNSFKDHSSSSSEEFLELKNQLVREQEKNGLLSKQITILQENVKELSKQTLDIEKIKENLTHEALCQAEAKFKQDKTILNNDLQNRINKVIELRVALEDSQETVRLLENRLTQGEKFVMKRNEYLEKSIEHVTGLYYQMLNERSALTIENQVNINKIIRMNERISFLEDSLKQKEMSRLDERSFAEEIAKLNNSRASRTSQINGNIRKPIKGGTRVV